jgi:peptidoglycan/xylan/chitin deacetylase (PgdA/CDA1 family)
MTADQIRYWSAQGIEFGAHSRSHADLTRLPPESLEAEVLGSKADLEELLGKPVEAFAYPFGFHNEEVVKCARGAFDLAFGIHPDERGINILDTDPCLLRRTMVQTRDSVIDVICRVRFGYSPIQRFRAFVRLRSRLKKLRA